MEITQRVIKQFTNEITDLKKNKGEGKKPFKPFLKKKIDSSPQIPPTSRINLENYAMEITIIHIMRTIQKGHALNS